jgi:hypothetical protein
MGRKKIPKKIYGFKLGIAVRDKERQRLLDEKQKRAA